MREGDSSSSPDLQKHLSLRGPPGPRAGACFDPSKNNAFISKGGLDPTQGRNPENSCTSWQYGGLSINNLFQLVMFGQYVGNMLAICGFIRPNRCEIGKLLSCPVIQAKALTLAGLKLQELPRQ